MDKVWTGVDLYAQSRTTKKGDATCLVYQLKQTSKVNVTTRVWWGSIAAYSYQHIETPLR
jgi:hypothetical protein